MILMTTAAVVLILNEPTQQREHMLLPDVLLKSNKSLRKFEIPKIFWTFWHSQRIPQFLTKCINTWRRSNLGFKIIILNPQTITEIYRIDLPLNFNKIIKQFQADWIRLRILKEYGGIWVDSSFIMTTSLDPLLTLQEKSQKDGLQFYMDKFTTNFTRPYYENWFIAAIPNATYISSWFIEFNICFERYGMDDRYLDHLQDTFGREAYSQMVQLNNAPGYLKQHITLQKVLLVEGLSGPMGISALQPPNGPFYLLDRLGWDEWELSNHLTSTPKPGLILPGFIKLTSFARNIMRASTTEGLRWVYEEYCWGFWKKRFYGVERGSIYCKYVGDCYRVGQRLRK